MVNLCGLLLKHANFSKVDDDIFIYIDGILENASAIYERQQRAHNELVHIEKLVAEKQKQLDKSVHRISRSPVKKRKVQSLDSPLSAYKENVSILDDSTIFPNKSDSDVSTKLEQNILDSEEPFFALTQSPAPPAHDPVSPLSKAILSPINGPKPCALRPTKLLFAEDNGSDKKILRESRFSKSFMSPEPSPKVEEKGTIATSPKVSSNGKWTGKKPGRILDASNVEQTPPTGMKRFHSLAEGNQRLRQAKLNFTRQTKQTPVNELEQVENETLFSDFIVPTPPSLGSKSKFLKSLRMKKQSTLVSNGQNNKSGVKERSDDTASRKDETEHNPLLLNDDVDIDQTYCSGVESANKDLSVRIKQEPDSEQKERQPLKTQYGKKIDCFSKQDPGTGEDTEATEVIVLPAPSQQSIISVAESQNDLYKFINEFNEANAERRDASSSGTNKLRVDREVGEPLHVVKPYIEQSTLPSLCIDCTKLYQFHTTRGISNDTARSKLPRNCRNCRLAQLHSTPPGFWDPDFIPTPQ